MFQTQEQDTVLLSARQAHCETTTQILHSFTGDLLVSAYNTALTVLTLILYQARIHILVPTNQKLHVFKKQNFQNVNPWPSLRL